MASILTIDLGTTFFKFALFGDDGQLSDVCRVVPPVMAGEPGRVEMAAEAFAQAIDEGLATLRKRNECGLAEVTAVSFATQTNSFVLLDDDALPLTPLILWPDERGRPCETEVCERCDIPDFTAVTGVPQVNYQFMAAKLLWLQRHTPDLWRKTRKICLLSDYLTFLMTGQFVTEAGAAGLTGLLDIHRCQWWPTMLDRLGIAAAWLPRVVRAGVDLGPITAAAANRFGLPATCRFVVGCLDQYAGAIGAGNVAPGMLSETTGTVLATVCCADQFAANAGPAVFQGPAFHAGAYWRMAFGNVSANYLQWYRDQLPDQPEFADLTALAETIAPGAEGLRLCTTCGMGAVDEVFSGLTAQHTRGHQVRCIMEAVAAALQVQVLALAEDAATHEIRCAGGAARSDLWLQIKADLLGIPTAAGACPEPTSLGAAILAQAALTDADVVGVARRWVSRGPLHQPDAPQRQQYKVLHFAGGDAR